MREQSADQADDTGPPDAEAYQRRRHREIEDQLSAEAAAYRVDGIAIEEHPGDQRADRTADESQKQSFDKNRDHHRGGPKADGTQVAISRERVLTAEYMVLSAPKIAPIAMMPPTK